ncbi:TIGR03943 family putative permease subunit [Microbacterium sp.]|uniref:TIGR03943 family putative permease subunit n=1 Tax=Microbacterium sp. TaxID=51671 RepID=UPI002E37074B|nr:TIGR03943 family protein [Microbacterium sp.]HEX5729560.1 TIGR03943 family protein [Microbacterium sp.]
MGTRWLGVGLAAILAVVTLGLALTGRLGLYINPESSWFAVTMAVVVLVGAALSFALPLGAEAEHGHDHGDEERSTSAGVSSRAFGPRSTTGEDAQRDEARSDHHHPHPAALAATAVGGVAASGVVLLTLVLPPASLSAELAMSRDVGAPPLFAGADAVTLAATGDTASFGVGEWATVFATATNPDAFDGDAVTLTGFVTPGDAPQQSGGFDLTRLVITHCVIDAQPASISVAASGPVPETGQWVTITGTVSSTAEGLLELDATSVEAIDEPEDPYEY